MKVVQGFSPHRYRTAMQTPIFTKDGILSRPEALTR